MLPLDHAEDAIQEVWLAAWRERNRFHGKDAVRKLCGWMRQVMLHKIADEFRHMARHHAVSLDTLPMAPAIPEGDELDWKRREWLAERLKETVTDDSLNDRLLRGRFIDGRTNAELAAEEDQTEKAVESRICRLIKELRQMATKDGLIVPSQEDGSPEGEKRTK